MGSMTMVCLETQAQRNVGGSLYHLLLSLPCLTHRADTSKTTGYPCPHPSELLAYLFYKQGN